MYTLSNWRRLPSGNLAVTAVFPNLRKVTLVLTPKTNTEDQVMEEIYQLTKRPFFGKDLP